MLFYCYADRKGQVQAEPSVCPRKPGQLTVSWRDRSNPCHLLQPWSPPELRTEAIVYILESLPRHHLEKPENFIYYERQGEENSEVTLLRGFNRIFPLAPNLLSNR